jgi:predicted nucleic acid-binding protein
MTRLLIDTNIVINLLAKRKEFYTEAASLFSLSDKKEIKLVITSLTFANTNYVLSKQLSSKEAKEILRKFKVLVEIISLDDKIIELALSDNLFSDFEDGLQYYSALENQIDILLTRNKKDFKNSIIPVMNAKEFLSTK